MPSTIVDCRETEVNDFLQSFQACFAALDKRFLMVLESNVCTFPALSPCALSQASRSGMRAWKAARSAGSSRQASMVRTHAAGEHQILVGGVDRHRQAVADQAVAREGGDGFFRLPDADRLFALHADADGMRAVDRHPHAGAGDLQVRQMHGHSRLLESRASAVSRE